jgi:hypothetical protein
LLTSGELRKLLQRAAPPVAFLPDSIAYTPAIAAEREKLQSAGEAIARIVAPICETPTVIDFEGRTAELQCQKQLILRKYAKPNPETGGAGTALS